MSYVRFLYKLKPLPPYGLYTWFVIATWLLVCPGCTGSTSGENTRKQNTGAQTATAPLPGSALIKAFAYGILPDTLQNYKVIWLWPAEQYIPVLTTFSKSGRVIAQERPGIGMCGSGCCYFCKELITIHEDYTIYASDYIQRCECDSTGPIDSTTRRFIYYKTGRIETNGAIRLSNMQTAPPENPEQKHTE